MADGVLTVTIPTVANVVSSDLDEIKENFEYLRRIIMNSCLPMLTGATIAYTYTVDKLTSLTFGGTLTGSATFTYTGDNLTSESWSLYGKTVAYTHTYSGAKISTTSVTVS